MPVVVGLEKMWSKMKKYANIMMFHKLPLPARRRSSRLPALKRSGFSCLLKTLIPGMTTPNSATYG
jgi:hypothetical protein